jgi:CRISPR/Cas system-associated exonuclease Cas4 (RecB family)
MTLVTDAMKKFYSSQVTPNDAEWNTKTLHASDLGFCATKLWARRNGLQTPYLDIDNRRQMAFGKLWEQEVAAALKFAGVEFTEQIEITGELFGVEIECHADFDVPSENMVIEAKTTEFWQGWKDSKKYVKTPDDVKNYHKIQGAASAMLLERKFFSIPLTDRCKGGQIEKVFETSNFISLIEGAIIERAHTAEGDPEPAFPSPVYEWECNSCAYEACPNNKNPFLQVI